MNLRTNDAYDDLFDYYGQIYNVDPALGKTVFHIESTGNPNAPNGSSGEQGGMQIMPKLARHYGIDPRDMTQAIPAAMANLAEGLQASGGDPAGALRYYNGGPKALQNPQSTNGYIAKAQSWFPHIQLVGSANAAPLDSRPAPDGAPDEQAFRSRWGLPGGASSASAGPDESAFRARWGLSPSGTSPPAATGTKPTAASDAAMSKPAAPQMGDPGTALNAAGGDQFIPNPLASNPSQGIYSALHALVARDPNYKYANNLPFAFDAQGHMHPALAGSAHDTLEGAVDLLFGPNMGTVTPGATNALASGMMLGGMRSPAYVPGRFSLFGGRGGTPPGAEPPPGTPGPQSNPLASTAIEAPGPSVAPAGRSFEVDAQGNVTQSGLPAVQPAAPTVDAPANPLISRPATPLTAPAAPAGRALTPAERIGYASMAALPAPAGGSAPAPGQVPPGWQWNPSLGSGGAWAPAPGTPPPGTPPPGVPGYTPTTPGINPANAPGLSPAEVAAYASMHDAPPPAPMFPPVTKAGAEALADQIIQYFHTGNGVQAGIALPPGYHPTLTGLTNDPGLATLHRGLESVSGTPAVIAQHNAQAINEAAAKLQGQPGDANTMAAQVNKVTTPLRNAAFANKTDMDPEKVQAAIDKANEILTGPDSKRTGVVKYVTQVRDSLLNGGKPETDPEQMYGAHKNINDLLSPLAQSQDADKAAASSDLMKLKPLVQNAIESGAPGFKAYMAKHAELMRPVDAQRLLENLNLTNASGDTRLAAVDSAIKAIEKQREMPGARKADSVTDDQMGQLVALRNALRMEAARATGKPINSTTFQNLATNSVVSRIGGSPLTGMLGGHLLAPGLGELAGYGASKVAESVFGRAEGLVRDALLERLLNFSGKGEATLAQPQRPPNRGPLNSGPFSADAYR